MAERTQAEIEKIKSVIINHQNWLKKKGGACADLSFQDLTGLNLPKIDLSGAKLSGVSLSGAKLMGANLSQCDLFGADLEGANLAGANLAGADLRGVNLHKAVLTDCSLSGADLRSDTLLLSAADSGEGMRRSLPIGGDFTGCDLSGADFNDADLSGADLAGAMLVGTDLSGALLDGALLGGVIVDQAMTLSRSYIPFDQSPEANFTYTEMTKEAFLAAVLLHERWVNSEGREGRRLNLSLVSVEGLDLTGRVLSAARLRRCRFKNTKWRKAKLEMADFSYSDLEGADLTEADLRGATLRRAPLGASKLVAVNAQPLTRGGGKMWPTNFDGADLSFADLRNSQAGAMIFSNTKLDGAKLDGSGIEQPTPESLAPARRPAAPQETSQQKRYENPVIMVQIGEDAYHSRFWSTDGVCFRIYEENTAFKDGDVGKAKLLMGRRMEITASVEFTVAQVDPRKRQVTIRYNRTNEELKNFLRFALQEYQRLSGR